MKFGEPTKLHRKSGIWGTHVRGGARVLGRSPSSNCGVLTHPLQGVCWSGGSTGPTCRSFCTGTSAPTFATPNEIPDFYCGGPEQALKRGDENCGGVVTLK
jgi:hypothetical protein